MFDFYSGIIDKNKEIRDDISSSNNFSGPSVNARDISYYTVDIYDLLYDVVNVYEASWILYNNIREM